MQTQRQRSAARKRQLKRNCKRLRAGIDCCQKCGKGLAEGEGQFHHIKHRSQGGTHDDENLILLCYECHQREHGIKVMGG